MRTAMLGLLLLLAGAPAVLTVTAGPAGAAPEQYRIETRSPESWAHYYELIGLGTVHRGPFSPADWEALTGHCAMLDELTGQTWIPLGYSRQRGYKLCYRTGPFLAGEADTFCARLLMSVRHNREHRIVCERDQALSPDEYRRLNPFLQ